MNGYTQATPVADFVVQIHSALGVRYGRRWLAMWAGLDMGVVAADWRRELRDFALNPGAVQFALTQLPDHPPTSSEFRRLCEAAPRHVPRPLPAPVMSSRGRDALRALSLQLKGGGKGYGQFGGMRGRGWAQQVLERKDRGEVVSPTVLRMAQEAAHAG